MMLFSVLLSACSVAADESPQDARLTLDEIHLRDPFILPVKETGRYYLFGTRWTGEMPGFVVYSSPDLAVWEGPTRAFRPPEGFWADRDFWAPEVHPYRGKYYMFASLKAPGACRGTQILVAEKPEGPYRPHSADAVTPRDWECLDGTLFVDDEEKPWMAFCHEWVQISDGTICALPLRDDLRAAAGEPVQLFAASEAPWVFEFGIKRRGRVTDGPCMYRASDGSLLMLWSSFDPHGYCLGVARSASGALTGPWTQSPEPLYRDDGGHGMLFRTFDGQLMLVLHQPNKAPQERPRLFEVEEKEASLVLRPHTTP